MIEAADLLGSERLLCSNPTTAGALVRTETVREANDAVLAAMKHFPGRSGGYCLVQPGNGAAALDEIERYLEAGMIGVKLCNQVKLDDPAVFPVAEKCIQRRVRFRGHSGHGTDARMQRTQPRISDPRDFCALWRRYPDLLLILGHLQGGGDWEWAMKGLRDCPNGYVDTRGSVLEDDAIERAVRELGQRRLLFAPVMTMKGGVGKILSVELTAGEREDSCWRNLHGLLERRRA